MSAKRKGSRNEIRSRDLLAGQGYAVTKAGGSLGAWDLIAVGAEDVLLVQVKSNRWPGLAEMNTLRNFECPDNCRKLVHRWDDYSREPQVREVAPVEPVNERGLTLPELLAMAGG